MYVEAFKKKEMFHLRFWRPNHRKKGMNYAFSSYKVTRKLCLVHLEIKLQQNRCGWLDLLIKMLQHERNKIFRGKQASNQVSLLFLDVKMLDGKFDRRFQTL